MFSPLTLIFWDVPYEFIQNFTQLPVLAYPNPNYQYTSNSFVSLLEDICSKEGLNQPVYTLHTTAGTDSEGKEIGLYMYKITIANSSNPAPVCSNNLMRTIEEAKNDAAEYVISQFFPQYLQSLADMNDQFVQCQSSSVMPNAIIPTIPYLTVGDAQNSSNESKCQEATNEQTSSSPTCVNSSNNTLVQNPYVLSQPVGHMPPIAQQYIIDSNGQYILYPTQAFY